MKYPKLTPKATVTAVFASIGMLMGGAGAYAAETDTPEMP